LDALGRKSELRAAGCGSVAEFNALIVSACAK
jgi:hypothetical protein